MRITGVAYPGRPVKVWLNGAPLGVIETHGRTTAEFSAGAGALIFVGDNDLTFTVAQAGLTGGDRRELGFGFMGAEIEPAEGCP